MSKVAPVLSYFDVLFKVSTQHMIEIDLIDKVTQQSKLDNPVWDPKSGIGLTD